MPAPLLEALLETSRSSVRLKASCVSRAQTTWGSIPWQSTGHWDGITLREQFATAFQVGSIIITVTQPSSTLRARRSLLSRLLRASSP